MKMRDLPRINCGDCRKKLEWYRENLTASAGISVIISFLLALLIFPKQFQIVFCGYEIDRDAIVLASGGFALLFSWIIRSEFSGHWCRKCSGYEYGLRWLLGYLKKTDDRICPCGGKIVPQPKYRHFHFFPIVFCVGWSGRCLDCNATSPVKNQNP
jgi:hypothetical protein